MAEPICPSRPPADVPTLLPASPPGARPCSLAMWLPGCRGGVKIVVSPLNVRDPSSPRLTPIARRDPRRCRPWPWYGRARLRSMRTRRPAVTSGSLARPARRARGRWCPGPGIGVMSGRRAAAGRSWCPGCGARGGGPATRCCRVRAGLAAGHGRDGGHGDHGGGRRRLRGPPRNGSITCAAGGPYSDIDPCIAGSAPCPRRVSARQVPLVSRS